jgi:hypothetical protein
VAWCLDFVGWDGRELTAVHGNATRAEGNDDGGTDRRLRALARRSERSGEPVRCLGSRGVAGLWPKTGGR